MEAAAAQNAAIIECAVSEKLYKRTGRITNKFYPLATKTALSLAENMSTWPPWNYGIL